MDLWAPCSAPASLSALLSDRPSPAALQHVETYPLLHSGLSVYVLPASSATVTRLVWGERPTSLYDRGQWVLRAVADVMLLQPHRHNSRQAGGRTDRPTDKPTSRLGVFIVSLCLSLHSEWYGQIRPEGKPLFNMLCWLCCIYKSAIHKCKEVWLKRPSEWKYTPTIKHCIQWSISVNLPLFPFSRNSIHVGMFISHG